jgi:hypothetical protein
VLIKFHGWRVEDWIGLGLEGESYQMFNRNAQQTWVLSNRLTLSG